MSFRRAICPSVWAMRLGVVRAVRTGSPSPARPAAKVCGAEAAGLSVRPLRLRAWRRRRPGGRRPPLMSWAGSRRCRGRRRSAARAHPLRFEGCAGEDGGLGGCAAQPARPGRGRASGCGRVISTPRRRPSRASHPGGSVGQPHDRLPPLEFHHEGSPRSRPSRHVILPRMRYCWRTPQAGAEGPLIRRENADRRVWAAGVFPTQAARRIRLIAAAVTRCWRCVLARPM